MRRRSLGLLVSAVLLAGGWFGLPPPADLGAAGWHALISLVSVLPMLALEALPDGVIALLLIAIWAVGGVVPAGVALSGFSSTTWVLTVASINSRTDWASGSYTARSRSTSSALMFSSVKSSMRRN